MALSQVIREVEEKPLYQVMFLKNDGHQNVYVEEVEEIDFDLLEEVGQCPRSSFI